MIALDSSFILAYKIDNDKHHEKAVKIMIEIAQGRYGMPIISDYIFDEVVTVMMIKSELSTAKDIGNTLIISAIVDYIDRGIFNKSWEIFQNQKNTRFSFTDCSLLAIMDKENIKHIATFDKDFSKINNINVIC